MTGNIRAGCRILRIGPIEATESEADAVRVLQPHHVTKLFPQAQVRRPVAAADVHRCQQDLIESMEGHQDFGLPPLQLVSAQAEGGLWRSTRCITVHISWKLID